MSFILSPAPRFALPNPLVFGFLRRSTAYIPIGVQEGEGVSGTAVGLCRSIIIYKVLFVGSVGKGR